jgi:mannose-6-phosphate isomerase-like protein (cupin superfamily)
MKKNKLVFLLILFVIILIIFGLTLVLDNKSKGVIYNISQIDSKAGQSYITNIIQETQSNVNFRKVLFTGTRSQLVVMSIPPGGEVGEETHIYTEQTLFFLSGTGKAILDGKESLISAGDVVVVTPGTKHNFINTGTVPLKIYTVYAPPNHIDGTIEATKSDADKNVQDETYGNQPK